MNAPDAAEIRREHRQIGSYLGLGFLVLYLAIPSGGSASIPLLFLLKDRLKLGPEGVSTFKLLIAAPTYVSFLFGFVRDRWSPFGGGDRAYFRLFGGLAVLAYASIALGKPDYTGLLIGALSATAAYRFLASSLQGLTAEVGQRRGMTGRLSSLLNIVIQVLAALATFGGGWVAGHLGTVQIYGFLALLSLVFVALSFWKPRAVYEAEPKRAAPSSSAPSAASLWSDVKATAKHRPLWPAVAIWLLWNFTPGFGTPFVFYFTDHLKGSSTQLGAFFGISALAFLPTLAVYGWLCRRVAFGKMLFWGVVIAVPQMIPLLYLRDAAQALWLAVPIGLMGGFATGATYDLVLRAAPEGREGTGTMLADAGLFMAVRFGDLFGAKLYAHGGYALTAWITTAVYALMLPMLLLVPRELFRRPDASDEEEARVEGGLAHR